MNRWTRTPPRQTLFFQPFMGPKDWNSMRFSFRSWTGTRMEEEKTSLPHTCSKGRPASRDYLLAPRPDRLMGEKDPLYTMLRKLRSRRQLGEARRLFYVAVTRARRELVMSGLARRKGDSFSTAAESPLGWLSEHYGIDELCGIDRIAWPRGNRNTPPQPNGKDLPAARMVLLSK